MNEDANIQTLREAYLKFQTGDFSGLIEHFDDDIYFIVPEIENVPYGGLWHRKPAAIKFFEILTSAEDISDYEAREFIATGDKVVVLGRMTSTVRSTGRHYSTEWVHVHTMQAGMITNFTVYLDTAAALRAFQMVTTALT